MIKVFKHASKFRDGRWRAGRTLLAGLVVGAVGGLVAPALADTLNPLDFPSLGKVTLASGAYSIDTTGTAPKLVGPGTNLSGMVSASGVAVFRFDDLTVDTGAVLTAAEGAGGEATRPVALLASGNLTFAGTLNASGASGGKGTRSTGGVGGEGRFGGDSGTGTRASRFDELGGSVNDVLPNVRLSGGGGGHGGVSRGSGSGGGGGGGGGGAVELGTLGTLTLTGSTITANGGNGGAGGGEVGLDAGRSDLGAGGGGGGGGAVLLHGVTVTLGGTINAHGGNGGKGRGFGMAGGGGRIAIEAIAKPDTTGISVAGGFCASIQNGANGVVFFAQPTLTPTNLDFGSVPVGSSITVNMTIQNTGGAESFINGQFPAVSAPFARVGSGLFSGLRQDAHSTCAYSFAPTAVGPFSQDLAFLSNAGPVSVTISGTGITHQVTADQLSRELSDGSAEVRARAAADLSELGYEAIQAVPALSAALQDDDAAVRSAAALAISRIGPEAAAAVANLISLLEDQDPITRQRALIALYSIGPAAEPAMEALKEALKDNALDNSSHAADALGRIGEPAIPALIEAMSHTNARTRGRAVLGLRSLGSKARKAVPDLAAALQGPHDPDGGVPNYAAWALGEMGADAKEALPALRQSLKESREALLFQFNAAVAMLLIDPSAEGAVEVLRRKDMMPKVSPLDAASALALVPTEAEATLPRLMKRLEDGEYPDNSQINVIHGVGRLGPKIGAPAVPRLEAIARNVQEMNRLAAAEALVKLTGNPDELLAVIDQELADESSERRADGLKALAKLGPQGQKLAERVIPLLKDNDWAIREAARSALKQIDPSRAKALKIPD